MDNSQLSKGYLAIDVTALALEEQLDDIGKAAEFTGWPSCVKIKFDEERSRFVLYTENAETVLNYTSDGKVAVPLYDRRWFEGCIFGEMEVVGKRLGDDETFEIVKDLSYNRPLPIHSFAFNIEDSQVVPTKVLFFYKALTRQLIRLHLGRNTTVDFPGDPFLYTDRGWQRASATAGRSLRLVSDMALWRAANPKASRRDYCPVERVEAIRSKDVREMFSFSFDPKDADGLLIAIPGPKGQKDLAVIKLAGRNL